MEREGLCGIGTEGEEEEPGSDNEDATADTVMRTEIVVAVKDSAQPTFEEIKEFESFSSKFAAVSSAPTVPFVRCS